MSTSAVNQTPPLSVPLEGKQSYDWGRVFTITFIVLGIILTAVGCGVGLNSTSTDTFIGMSALGCFGFILFVVGLCRIYQSKGVESVPPPSPPQEPILEPPVIAPPIVTPTPVVPKVDPVVRGQSRPLKHAFFVKFLEKVGLPDAATRSFPILGMHFLQTRRQNEYIIQKVKDHPDVPCDNIFLIETDNDADSLYFPMAGDGVLIRAWEWDDCNCIRVQAIPETHSLNWWRVDPGYETTEKFTQLRALLAESWDYL